MLILCMAAASVACAGDERAGAPVSTEVWFEEVAAERGLSFVHNSGHKQRYLLPEIIGGGVALVDVDGDDDLDVYLVQSGEIDQPGNPGGENRLYLNDGGARFTDVTQGSGAGDRGYGIGVTAGDYDGDGDTDLYVTNVGPNVLLQNDGSGRFLDVTEQAGVGDPAWGTAAAFTDIDADGDLDLFVVNYINWTVGAERQCTDVNRLPDYCPPAAFDSPARDSLYLNRGDGTFVDVSDDVGLGTIFGNGLGVVAEDFDGDGRVDIFVANDVTVNQLWMNRGERLVDEALLRGCALDEQGLVKAGMGVVSEDYEDDGDADLLVVNLRGETDSFFRNEGEFFSDHTAAARLSLESRWFTRFGVGLVDFDNDGTLDLYEANGRISKSTEPVAEDVYAEPNLLFRGRPDGRFAEFVPRGGTRFVLNATSRAAAFGDLDNDGGVDIVVVNRDSPVHLLLNVAADRGRWASFRVLDRNRADAIGARVIIEAGQRRRWRTARTAYSYLASNDPRVHFGLGSASTIDQVAVRWPDGSVEEFGQMEVDRFAVLRRDEGSLGTAAKADTPEAPQIVAQPADEALAEFQRVCESLHDGDNSYLGTAQIAQLKQRISVEDNPGAAARLRSQLGNHLIRLGRNQEAIGALNESLELIRGAKAGLRYELPVLRLLALAHLRIGEQSNCNAMHGPESCILPLSSAAIHRDRSGSEAALALYLEYLEGDPEQPLIQWLLNISAMTLDRYPESVPERFRVPPDALVSSYDIGHFPNIARSAGVRINQQSGGGIVDDFDGDGLLDIVSTTIDPCGPAHFFKNTGDGQFTDRSRQSGLTGQLGGLNVTHADYDNDGDLDLLVLRGGWLAADGRIRNSLLRNDGTGRFADVTRSSGMAEPAYPTQTAAWADYDGDGDLDVYIGNEIDNANVAYPSQLYRNNGNGSFTDVAEAAGVTNFRMAKGVAWGDYDNDGDPDLYVSNLGPNRFYRNDGEHGFTDVAPELGLTEPADRSFATWFFDYDNDGHLDLFVAAYDASKKDVASSMLGRRTGKGHPLLYHNLGDGSFEELSRAVGLVDSTAPMGSNFGDLDNDGYPDLYLGTGTPSYESIAPNLMYRNDAGRRFQNVTYSGGFGHLQKGHGVAFGDLDNDGDQDLFEQMGGAYPGDAYPSVLYENPGHGNRWLTLRLIGTRSNRFGVGARIRVTVVENDRPREIHALVGTGGSFGGSSHQQEIGLGRASAIRELRVDWPGSGTRQVFHDVGLDRAYEVHEGIETLGAIELARFRLGGRSP